MILGNGFPNSSSLENYINLLKIKGYYPDDVAYAAVYIYIWAFGGFTFISNYFGHW